MKCKQLTKQKEKYSKQREMFPRAVLHGGNYFDYTRRRVVSRFPRLLAARVKVQAEEWSMEHSRAAFLCHVRTDLRRTFERGEGGCTHADNTHAARTSQFAINCSVQPFSYVYARSTNY